MSKKAILLLGIPLGLGLAAGLAFVLIFVVGVMDKAQVPDPAEGQHGLMIPLADQVVNLTSSTDGYRYCKIGVTIEVRPEAAAYYTATTAEKEATHKEAVAAYGSVLPVLSDIVGRAVASRDSAVLGTEAGRQALLDQITAEFSEALGATEEIKNPGKEPIPGVKRLLNVYFTTLVMQ